MKAKRTKIATIIADSTLQHGVKKPFSKEVAAYLLNERRVNELDSILRDVQADWAKAGYVEVLASSAHPLAAGVKADIQRQVKAMHPDAKQIIVTEVHDDSIVGGVRLNLANQQLDMSIAAKLSKFKQLTSAGKD